jgi:hypothetical protein
MINSRSACALNADLDPASLLALWLPRLQARAAAAGVPVAVAPPLGDQARSALRDRCVGQPTSLIIDLDRATAFSAAFRLGSAHIDLTTVQSQIAGPSELPRDLFPARLELVDEPGRLVILVDLCQARLAQCPVYALLAQPPIVVQLARCLAEWLAMLGRSIPVDRENRSDRWGPFSWSGKRLRAFDHAARLTATRSRDEALVSQDWALSAWAAAFDGTTTFTDFRKADTGNAFHWSLRPPISTFQRHRHFPLFAMTPLVGGLGLWNLITGSERNEISRCQALLARGAVASLVTLNTQETAAPSPWPPIAEAHFQPAANR